MQGMAVCAAMPPADDTLIVIPITRIAFIDTKLPRVSAAKRAQLVNFAIEDKLTIDPATVHAIIIGESLTAADHHIIAAISSVWLVEVLHWLQQAGITPTAAIAESAMYARQPGEWRVVLDGRHGMVIRPDGLAATLDADNPATPPFQLLLALNEAVAAESGRATPATIRVHSPPNQAGLDLARWRQQIGEHITLIAEPTPTMPAADIHAGSNNFLLGGFLPASRAASAINVLKPAWILVFVIIFLHVLFVGVDAWRLEHTRKNIETSMRQIFQSSFPEATTIVDPALQMSRNLARIKTERGLTSDALRDLLAVAAGVTQRLPADVAGAMTNVSATVDPHTLTMTFKKLTAEQRATLQAATNGRLVRSGEMHQLILSGARP